MERTSHCAIEHEQLVWYEWGCHRKWEVCEFHIGIDRAFATAVVGAVHIEHAEAVVACCGADLMKGAVKRLIAEGGQNVAHFGTVKHKLVKAGVTAYRQFLLVLLVCGVDVGDAFHRCQ